MFATVAMWLLYPAKAQQNLDLPQRIQEAKKSRQKQLAVGSFRICEP
jgi:hypothetical protein